MSTVQAMASQQFVAAMGPMINNPQTMNQVMSYIALLRHQAEPCQCSVDEMRGRLSESIADARAGKVTAHADLKREIAQWL